MKQYILCCESKQEPAPMVCLHRKSLPKVNSRFHFGSSCQSDSMAVIMQFLAIAYQHSNCSYANINMSAKKNVARQLFFHASGWCYDTWYHTVHMSWNCIYWKSQCKKNRSFGLATCSLCSFAMASCGANKQETRAYHKYIFFMEESCYERFVFPAS